MHFLRLLLELEEEEGVLLDPRKAFSTVGVTVPYPITRSSPSWTLPLADRLTQSQSQRFPSGSGEDLDNLSKHRLVNNDKPLPMGQGCINEIIIILSIDGGHNNDLTS